MDPKTKLTYFTHKRTHEKQWRPPYESVKPIWHKRFSAGCIDFGVSMLAAFGCNLILLFELDDPQLAGVGAAAGFAMTFMCRDAMFESGTRSYGKRKMKLEIVREIDGSIRAN